MYMQSPPAKKSVVKQQKTDALRNSSVKVKELFPYTYHGTARYDGAPATRRRAMR